MEEPGEPPRLGAEFNSANCEARPTATPVPAGYTPGQRQLVTHAPLAAAIAVF